MVLGEAGLGKTRLVQEFYSDLVAATQPGGVGYWPAALGRVGDNLSVNPPDATWDPGHPMPFLWWAVRLVDPAGHNQLGMSVLAGHVERHLAPHLEATYRAERDRQRLRQLARMGGEVVADAVTDLLPVLGLVKKVAEAGAELKGLHDAWRADRAPLDPTAFEAARRTSLVDQIVADLTTLFGRRGGQTVPMVVLVDDAHFSRYDPAVTTLVQKLLDAMTAGNWPLLLVLTHWEREWFEEVGEGDATIASSVRSHASAHPGAVTVVPLRPVEDLEPVVRAALPGLTAEQRFALLERAGGNPRYLDELLLHTTSPLARAWFEGRDVTGAMTEAGLRELLGRATSLSELALRRFGEAPEVVQRVLALAGLQGTTFLTALVRRAAAELDPRIVADLPAAMDRSERIHAYLVNTSEAVASFRQPLYHDVAGQYLPAYYDGAEADAALATALRDAFHDPEVLGAVDTEAIRVLAMAAVRSFTSAEAGEDRRLAAQGFYLLLTDALRQGDVERALTLAHGLNEVSAGLEDGHLDGDLAWIRAADAAFSLAGELEPRRALLARLLRLTGEAYDDDVNPWTRRMYLDALSTAVEFFAAQGEAGNVDEGMALAFQVVDGVTLEEDDVPSLSSIAEWFRRFADWLVGKGSYDDAASVAERAVVVGRHLVSVAPSPVARLHLVAALCLSVRVVPLAGREVPALARTREAVAVAREVVAEEASADARLQLAAALDAMAAAELSDATAGRGEDSDAGAHDRAIAAMTESLAIVRDLDQGSGATHAYLRDVADSLERLARAHSLRGEPQPAWDAALEALAARRTVAERSDTMADAASLSQAMTLAARVAEARGDRATAMGLAREGADLADDLLRPGDAWSAWRWLDAWHVVTTLEALDDERAAVRARLAAFDRNVAYVPRESLAHVTPVLAAMETIRAELAAVDGDLVTEARARTRARTYEGGALPAEPMGPPSTDGAGEPD